MVLQFLPVRRSAAPVFVLCLSGDTMKLVTECAFCPELSKRASINAYFGESE